MGIYRIFPKKDATIYSQNPVSNTGKDEILEISGYEDISGVPRATRALIQFDSEEINSFVVNNLNGKPISASIKLNLAEASEIPIDFTVYTYPLSQSWVEGRGKFGDIPVDDSGVSWRYISSGQSELWKVSSYSPNSTGSYILGQAGGGCWVVSVSGSSVTSSVNISTISDLDLNIDVSNSLTKIYSGSLSNYGYVIKLEDSLEFNTTSSVNLKYFSTQTNTIYSPFLEFKWDDSTHLTGSLSTLSSTNNVIVVNNLNDQYVNTGIIKFRLNARPKFPVRTFTTSSIYLINYALPVESYWGLQDEYTKEMVINFDKFTRISCDNTGPFFNLYTNTLSPERFYRIFIKTTIDNVETVVNSNNVFKLVKNG